MFRKYSKKKKYNNGKVEYDGITFDSKKEYERYLELKSLQAEGKIKNLQVHVLYTLQEGFCANGKKYRPIKYEADFVWIDCKDDKKYVEDVKAVRTQLFDLKLKMLLYHYPGINFLMYNVLKKKKDTKCKLTK